MSTELLVFVLVGVLSYVNGANDVSKGVSTLVGSGLTTHGRALLWGTIWTTVGAYTAAQFSTAMVQTFSSGMSASGLPIMVSIVSIVIATSLWTWIATQTGLPVSTTHAITGSMVGVILLSGGLTLSTPAISFLTKSIMPLLLSPLAAFGLSFAVSKLLHPRLERAQSSCLCITRQPLALVPVFAIQMTATPAHFADVHTQHSIMHGSVEECSDSPSVSSRFRILDAAHYLTAGLTSFARGLNDAPKIIPFLLLVPALTVSPLLGYVYIGTGMGIGGLISGRKVLQTLSHRIAPMSHTDGFLANAITSSLVGVGAWFGLPMSTTHVSATSIVGTGVGQGKKVSWRVVRDIATAWVVTIPAAAFIAALASVVMQWLVS